MTADPPRGWYVDPTGVEEWRWWDGSQWTDRVPGRWNRRRWHHWSTARRVVTIAVLAVVFYVGSAFILSLVMHEPPAPCTKPSTRQAAGC